MLVGAPGDTSSEGGIKAGSAYIVSQQQGSFSSTNSQKIFPSGVADRSNFTLFGCSVSLDGNLAAIGVLSVSLL